MLCSLDLDDPHFLNEFIVPIFKKLGNDKMNTGSAKKDVYKVLDYIWQIPGFINSLRFCLMETPCGILNTKPVGWFVLVCCRENDEARQHPDMENLAKLLISQQNQAARPLRTLFGLELEADKKDAPVARAVGGVDDLGAQAGGRHDNDHECYRDIQHLPTVEEIATTEQPHLPRYHVGEAHMLDRLFRLLREDFVGPARNELKELFSGKGNPRNIYPDMTVEYIDAANDKEKKFKRCSLMVSFMLPNSHKSYRKEYYNKKKRVQFWDTELKGMLPTDAVVGIVNGKVQYSEDVGANKLLGFATVVRRESEELAGENVYDGNDEFIGYKSMIGLEIMDL